jgi:2,4-diaminopentanoate dehydrogenase
MLRVVQWTTGNVGAVALDVISRRPDLELVGVYAFSPDKVGVDAGTLCGSDESTGILATDDVDALIALKPDCISYTPLLPDLDLMERFLAAGINVATTSNFFRGDYLSMLGMPDARARIEAAALKGGSSLFGGGYNPGFVTSFPLLMASINSSVDLVEMFEAADLSHYPSETFFGMLGWGQTPDANGTIERPVFAEMLDGFLYDGLDIIADAIGFEITDRVVSVEYAVTPKRVECAAMTFEAGTIAGQKARWEYKSGDDTVMAMNITWWASPDLQPNFAAEHAEANGVHRVEITGEPSLELEMRLSAPTDGDPTAHMKDGIIGTAMNAVNAIPALCAAAPGLRSYLDMPLYTGMWGKKLQRAVSAAASS